MRNMKLARGASHEPPKTLHHIEVKEAENGGHVVTHHFKGGGGTYHEPEEHVFGADEGGKAIEHIGSAANIDAASGDGKPEHSKQLEEEEGKEGE